MSVVFGMQTKDLIGATVIAVDGRDAEGDIFDFKSVTLKLINGKKVRIEVDEFEEGYLDIDKVIR